MSALLSDGELNFLSVLLSLTLFTTSPYSLELLRAFDGHPLRVACSVFMPSRLQLSDLVSALVVIISTEKFLVERSSRG